VSPVEVRQKLREEVRAKFFPNAPIDELDQTDDNVFSMFDVDGDE
jgi:hypothetical protein